MEKKMYESTNKVWDMLNECLLDSLLENSVYTSEI